MLHEYDINLVNRHEKPFPKEISLLCQTTLIVSTVPDEVNH